MSRWNIPAYIIKEALRGRGYRNKRLKESSNLVEVDEEGRLGVEYAYKVRGSWKIAYRYDGSVNILNMDDDRLYTLGFSPSFL